MSQGLYSGVSGLSIGIGLYKSTQGLWSGASGLITPISLQTLSLNFLTGTLDPRITFTRTGAVATFVGSNGLIQTAAADTPRFDYNPVTLALKGLLLEEAKANIALYSEQFDNAAWVKGTTATVTANATTSPDGTANADKLIDNANNVVHNAQQTAVAAAASSVSYTLSVFLKTAELGYAFIGLGGTAFSTAPYISVNLSTGATASTNGSPTNISATSYGSGWWRVVLTGLTTTIGSVIPDIRLSQDGIWANRVYVGTGQGIYLWGAQLEQTAVFASSYVPTTATLVTRGADVATMTGTNFSDWFNPVEGTFVSTASVISTATNRSVYSASDGTFTSEFFHFATTSSNNIINNGANSSNIAGVVTPNVAFTDAFAYKVLDLRGAANGILGPQTSTPSPLPTVNQLRIGARGNGTFYLNAHVRSINYYNTRLPDGALQSLTT